MARILFQNEEGHLEIGEFERAYIDPDAPTDVLIRINFEPIKIRIRHTDVDEANAFMEVLFDSDAINLIELLSQSPKIVISVEDADDDFKEYLDMMAELSDMYDEDSEEDDYE